MGTKGKLIPPNAMNEIIELGKASPELYAFLLNLSRTAPLSGSGSPESVVDAGLHTTYIDEDAVATPGTFFYVKTTETGTTGWKLT